MHDQMIVWVSFQSLKLRHTGAFGTAETPAAPISGLILFSWKGKGS